MCAILRQNFWFPWYFTGTQFSLVDLGAKSQFLTPPTPWLKGKPLTTFSAGKNDKFPFQGKRKEMKKQKKKSTSEEFRPDLWKLMTLKINLISTMILWLWTSSSRRQHVHLICASFKQNCPQVGAEKERTCWSSLMMASSTVKRCWFADQLWFSAWEHVCVRKCICEYEICWK